MWSTHNNLLWRRLESFLKGAWYESMSHWWQRCWGELLSICRPLQVRGGLERAVEEKDSKKEMMKICRMVIGKKERKIKTNLTSIFVKLHFGVWILRNLEVSNRIKENQLTTATFPWRTETADKQKLNLMPSFYLSSCQLRTRPVKLNRSYHWMSLLYYDLTLWFYSKAEHL